MRLCRRRRALWVHLANSWTIVASNMLPACLPVCPPDKRLLVHLSILSPSADRSVGWNLFRRMGVEMENLMVSGKAGGGWGRVQRKTDIQTERKAQDNGQVDDPMAGSYRQLYRWSRHAIRHETAETINHLKTFDCISYSRTVFNVFTIGAPTSDVFRLQ